MLFTGFSLESTAKSFGLSSNLLFLCYSIKLYNFSVSKLGFDTGENLLKAIVFLVNSLGDRATNEL